VVIETAAPGAQLQTRRFARFLSLFLLSLSIPDIEALRFFFTADERRQVRTGKGWTLFFSLLPDRRLPVCICGWICCVSLSVETRHHRQKALPQRCGFAKPGVFKKKIVRLPK
jgi:hypothetical protein